MPSDPLQRPLCNLESVKKSIIQPGPTASPTRRGSAARRSGPTANQHTGSAREPKAKTVWVETSAAKVDPDEACSCQAGGARQHAAANNSPVAATVDVAFVETSLSVTWVGTGIPLTWMFQTRTKSPTTAASDVVLLPRPRLRIPHSSWLSTLFKSWLRCLDRLGVLESG